ARPLEIIPQFGFDPQLFRPREAAQPPTEPGQPFVVGCISRLEEAKGLLVLLRAVAALAPEREVILHIAGTGPLRSALEALAAELGIAECVILHGQVPST